MVILFSITKDINMVKLTSWTWIIDKLAYEVSKHMFDQFLSFQPLGILLVLICLRQFLEDHQFATQHCEIKKSDQITFHYHELSQWMTYKSLPSKISRVAFNLAINSGSELASPTMVGPRSLWFEQFDKKD